MISQETKQKHPVAVAFFYKVFANRNWEEVSKKLNSLLENDEPSWIAEEAMRDLERELHKVFLTYKLKK